MYMYIYIYIQFVRLKYRFLNFCASFIPDFENLHYLLHLDESEDDVSEKKDLKNDSSVAIRDVNTSSIDNKLNVKDNAAKMLDNRLESNFVSKNVVNLSKGLNFVSTSNTVDKAKLKMELEALGRILRLK